MKKVILYFSIAFAIFCFQSCKTSQASQRGMIEKVISSKDAPIESRYSIGLFGEGYRSDTIYYLYADDGTSIKVDRSFYNRVKIGDKVKARWK